MDSLFGSSPGLTTIASYRFDRRGLFTVTLGNGQTWEQLGDDRLLDNLERSQAAFEASRAVLQSQIDTLRKREVSWSKIGDALGVSRQAAWERFG